MGDKLNQSVVSTVSEVDGEEDGKKYKDLLKFANKISNPMAGKKLTGRIYKCLKKAADKKIARGVKEVTKKMKKGGKGVVIFAGDVQPIEVMCHLPVMCEDRNLLYCYVPSRQKLGGAIGSSKPTCTIFIDQSSDKKSYDRVVEGIKELPSVFT